jgi:hypothetical protein
MRLRRLVFPLAAAIAVLAVGSAFAVYRDVIDFGQAEPAPERIMLDFNRMSVHAQIGLFGPRVIPGSARKVTAFAVGGKRRALYVAPTREGGFCWRFAFSGSCGRTHPDQRLLGAVVMESAYAPSLIVGHVLDDRVVRIELRYEDGERLDLRPIWISSPIDAGFYAHAVPSERLRPGSRAETLTALDADGDKIVQVALPHTDPRWEPAPDGLPRIADRSQKRTLFDFRDHRDRRRTLVVAPAPGDRLCFAHDGGAGCLSPKFPATIEGMSIHGGPTVQLCCAVSDGVATVELRYEDGERTELEPVDGFLLYAIPLEHYPRGHRIEGIVWRDGEGREIASRTIATRHRGVYPCEPHERIELGYGSTVCP